MGTATLQGYASSIVFYFASKAQDEEHRAHAWCGMALVYLVEIPGEEILSEISSLTLRFYVYLGFSIFRLNT
jgi:hypothetical protein